MKTETRRERRQPTRGVVGCLTAGFEMVGQNPSLVALPVVLDLLLWFGPRVSVRPMMQALIEVLSVQVPTDPEALSRVAQATELLRRFGAQFNLVSVAGGIPLFQVPSLLVRHGSAGGSPLGDPRVFALSSPLTLMPSWAAFGLVGLVLGFFYLNEIAHQVRVFTSPFGANRPEVAKGAGGGQDATIGAGVWKLVRFVLFAAGLLAIGSAVASVWLLVVALGTMIAQPLGVLFWIGGAGFLGYAAVHLIFVVPSLLLGDGSLRHAIGESILLSHLNLWPLFGFLALTLVIYEGLGFAWSLPPNESWVLSVGILGNAFVATGLTGAAFVFYRDRVRVVRQLATRSD